MSERRETKRYRDRLRQLVKGAVKKGVPFSVEQRFALLVQELLEYEGDYDPEIVQFFDHLLRSSNKNAHDIMIPRSRMVFVTPTMSLQEIVNIVRMTGHSRYPIQGEKPGEVTGLLYVKDLFTSNSEVGDSDFNVNKKSKPVHRVAQDLSIVSLLQELKNERIHMAVVENEFDQIVGLVTMEDVFEQFFGEIQDEHDRGEEAELLIEREDDSPDPSTNGETTIAADLSIDEFNEHFGSSLSNHDNNTIGGFVVTKLGHVPQKGEKTRADDLLLEVVEASNRRIERISVVRNGL